MGRIISKEFKEEAVRLVIEQGVGVKQASAELGVSMSALGKWVRERRGNKSGLLSGSGKSSPDDQRIRELEKKVRVLEMERDILKKATAFFAKDSL